MTKLAEMPLGVQSYCFRNFKDNDKVAQMVRQIGVDRVELCEVHVDFHDLKAFKEAVRTYQERGVAVVSLGVQTFRGLANERDWFECAREAGAKTISAHFEVDTFPQAIESTQRLCDEYGVRVAIHNHGGYQFTGSRDVCRHLIKLGSPQIGLCLDTAWALQIGPWRGSPVEWVKEFAGSLYGLHLKDFVFDRNAQWHDVVVGAGNVDLPLLAEALDETGFGGYAVVEYEADPDDPVPALKHCVQAIRKVWTSG